MTGFFLNFHPWLTADPQAKPGHQQSVPHTIHEGSAGCLDRVPAVRLFARRRPQDGLRPSGESPSWRCASQLALGKSNAAGYKNPTEAVRWFRKAAEQGSAEGQYHLAVSYYFGFGQGKDLSEAAYWYRKAAEQGMAGAQYYLGQQYARGDGVRKNAKEAVKWFLAAAEQGHATAQLSIGFLFQTGEGVEKNASEAVKWYRKSAEKGLAEAQYNLGLCYAGGEGTTKNLSEAVTWFKKASEQGNAQAQFFLSTCYYSGDGVPKDIDEAVKWLRSAAETGYPRAQYQLGRLYDKGEGVTKDPTEAVKWYRTAAEQGLAEAQNNLAVCYAYGLGVLKDEIEALALFSVSALSGSKQAAENRDALEKQLGSQNSLAAQRRSKEILERIEACRAQSRESDTSEVYSNAEYSVSPKYTGTGAVVLSSGYVLTVAHVVADAKKITVETIYGTKTARVVRIDESNDLAVLKLNGGNYTALPIAPSRRVRLGQSVSTIGFPHVALQGFSPKVTRGEISSANGFGDDPRSWQISVPVQAGNSGGPLLDEYGNLVGVVVAKLGLKAAQSTGDIIQNVNYAVKSSYALALLEPFLDGSTPEPNQTDVKPSFEDMVANAQKSVVLILVY